MNSIFLKSLCKYGPSLQLSVVAVPIFSGLKSGVTKCFEPTALASNDNNKPQKVLGKIFQLFFTTKPTRQGTGWELSLSYDIVKAHGGELKVETKEEEGSEFIIQLPLVRIIDSEIT